jgi:hypothetical protein
LTISFFNRQSSIADRQLDLAAPRSAERVLSFGVLRYPPTLFFCTQLITSSYRRRSRPTRNCTGSLTVRSFFSSLLSSTIT